MEKNHNAERSVPTERLEAFSDGVFAIVITLLFLTLRVPEIGSPGDWRELAGALLAAGPKFLSILISFTFVAIFWVAHHQFFHTLQNTTRTLLLLNVLFLFLVCFVPYPAAIMAEFPHNKSAAVFFGAAVWLASAMLTALRWYAWVKHKEISGVTDERGVHQAMRRGAALMLLYGFGIAVSFVYPVAAVVLYLLTPLALLFPIKVEIETRDEEKDEIKL